MVEKIKQLVGFGEPIARYDEIMSGLYDSVRKRNDIFHFMIIAVEVLLLAGLLVSGTDSYKLISAILYVVMMALTIGVFLLERHLTGQVEEDIESYYQLEACFLVIFLVWGGAVTVFDQMRGTGMAIFYFVLFIAAWISMMKPWKTMVVFTAGFLVLNMILPGNTSNNVIYGLAAVVIASSLTVGIWHTRIDGKLAELTVAGHYAEIEKKNDTLNVQAHLDILTGLGNRFEYEHVIGELMLNANGPVACIYIDANGLHELNNHLGHDAGDEMLRTIGKVILQYFTLEESFRIGGDEFVVLCQSSDEMFLQERISAIKKDVEEFNYSVSAGLDYSNYATETEKVIQTAENRMREDKLAFYAGPGAERQKRVLNDALEKVLTKKKDTDRFLTVIEPIYKGVYFVDLDTDTVRDVFMPDEFRGFLEKSDNKFSIALQEFSKRMIRKAYFPRIQTLCNYDELREKLEKDKVVKLTYDQMDGYTIRLRIYPVEKTQEEAESTLWIFDEDN